MSDVSVQASPQVETVVALSRSDPSRLVGEWPESDLHIPGQQV